MQRLEVLRRLRTSRAGARRRDRDHLGEGRRVAARGDAPRRRPLHRQAVHVHDASRAARDATPTLRARLERLHEAEQHEIDRLYALLRTAGEEALPKGISAPTLALVAAIVRDADGDLSATEVAERAGISRGTARRYLEFLAESGSLELTLRYGAAGRPEHLYRWAGAPV